MSRKIKTIGLAFLVVCAFGAVAAAAAQAEPVWTVNGAGITTNQAVSSTVTLTKFGSETTPSLSLTVPGLGITITCTGASLDSAVLIPPSSDTVKSITLSGCIVVGATTKCQVKDSVVGVPGEIHTNALNTTLKKIGTKYYDIYSAETSPFLTIVIEKKTGQTCSVSGTFEVKGTTASTVGPEAVTQEGESSEAVSTATGTELTFGGKKAILDAKADLTLVSGSKWGVSGE
jgi:hypothetical protein